MICKAWEVWYAAVKYEDKPTIQDRPVLILDDKTVYAICLKLTGTSPRPGEYALIEWAAAGLSKPTTVRIGKVLHMKENDFRRKIGNLTPLDIANVQALLLGS